MKIHRNSQKRIIEEGLVYFVTTNTKDRYSYFNNEVLCELFVDELKLAKEMKKFELYGFVILYDHVHLLIKPNLEIASLPKIMFSIKKQFSHDANRILGHNNHFDNVESGQTFARFHKNLRNLYSDEKIKFSQHFYWQPSYHDHIIRGQRDFNNHLNYINTNHLKHNLPKSWKYVGFYYVEMLDL